jgi:hypothetical protein
LLPPLLSIRREDRRESMFLDKNGTIVPCLNHTAQLERSMGSKTHPVNSVMKYCAAAPQSI